MKISKYTKLIKLEDRHFIYNSISNFLCEIDNDLFLILNFKRETKGNINYDEIDDAETWELLITRKIITKNENDDLLQITSSFEMMRRASQSMNLTIAPTMDCNFSCHYCFETKKKGAMDSKIVENIINYVNNMEQIKEVFVTWFGGEPLLQPEIINQISVGIANSDKYKYSAQIITNGYYLTATNLKMLLKNKVKHVQISLDGIFEEHNKTRFSKTDKDSFSKIIKNIDYFHMSDFDLILALRINLDSKNLHTYEKIHDYFTNKYKNDNRISFAPAFIQDTTKKNNKTTINDFEEKLHFWKNTSKFDSSKNCFFYPDNKVNECSVRNYNSWAIDSEGLVYKCWEIIGNEEYAVGTIGEKGININNEVLLRRYLFGANHLESNRCRDCFSLPVCNGGCPHKRIENEFNGKNFNMCTYQENNLEKIIIERIKRSF